MRALIIGGSGFAGRHLTSLLDADGVGVIDYSLGDGRDVRDYECLRECLLTCAPDQVYFLAAQTSPSESWTDPRRALDIMVAGALNLLEAMRLTDSHARVLMVGSEAEYGWTMRDGRVTEWSPCRPATPYAAAKLAATNLAQAYADRYGLPIVVARPAYHTGPGQHPRFAVSAFARRVAEVEASRRGEVVHGDLSAVRAMLDVRDVVRAYRAAIDLEPGIYNVAADESWSMAEVLAKLIELTGEELPTKQDPRLGRLADSTPWYPMCHERLTDAGGWEPQIPFAQTLEDLLTWWRKEIL